jgi:hypothetical protein
MGRKGGTRHHGRGVNAGGAMRSRKKLLFPHEQQLGLSVEPVRFQSSLRIVD